MKRRTLNDEILSKYFREHSEDGHEIPYMTVISKDTNISVATISRFAQRKGFYNFAEMRAHFNLSLGKNRNIFDDHGLINLLKDVLNAKNHIYIIPSIATNTIGYHIRERLNEMNIKTDMRKYKNNKTDEFANIKNTEVVILTSLSGKSSWYESYINANLPNKAILLSTAKPNKINKTIIPIVLSDFKLNKNNKIEKNRAVRQVLEWVDDVLTQLQIELENKKIKIYQ